MKPQLDPMEHQAVLIVGYVQTLIRCQNHLIQVAANMIIQYLPLHHKLPSNKVPYTSAGQVGREKVVSGSLAKLLIPEEGLCKSGIDYFSWHALWELSWTLCFYTYLLCKWSLFACLSTRSLQWQSPWSKCLLMAYMFFTCGSNWSLPMFQKSRSCSALASWYGMLKRLQVTIWLNLEPSYLTYLSSFLYHRFAFQTINLTINFTLYFCNVSW